MQKKLILFSPIPVNFFCLFQVFARGSVRMFLMSTEESLGSLDGMRIWHDNSGKDDCASWYLDHVVITDLQTSKM